MRYKDLVDRDMQLWTDYVVHNITGSELAVRYGISRQRVSQIVHRLSQNREAKNRPLTPSLPVQLLPLSVRARNCLYRGNILTLQDVLDTSASEINDLQHAGIKTIVEILDFQARARERVVPEPVPVEALNGKAQPALQASPEDPDDTAPGEPEYPEDGRSEGRS